MYVVSNETLMRLCITFFLVMIRVIALGQTDAQKDSIINVMCEFLKRNSEINDSSRIMLTYNTHFYPFLNKFKEQERQEIGTNVYYRFQKNCVEFKELLDMLEPLKNDEIVVVVKPKPKLQKDVCKQFNQQKHLYYLESTGDTVKLEIKN